MMGKPASRYDTQQLIIGAVVGIMRLSMGFALLACWSCILRDGCNQVIMAAGAVSDAEETASGVLNQHKRVPLVQREASAAGALSSFSPLLSKSQAERLAALQEMQLKESGRIQFIKAKLGLDNIAAGNKNDQSALSTSPLYSGQIVNTVNYVMTVGLGTPASELLMAIDTGSDLAWTQCLPCAACYNQRDTFFDPSASSSYKKVPCSSEQCAQLGSSGSAVPCSSRLSTEVCQYIIGYGDGSLTTGDFAMEALSVSGEAVTKAYPFGCGHVNQGLFKGYDGLLGLSRSSLAFPAQTKTAFGGVFAYCMPRVFSKEAGYIEFGSRRGAAAAGGAATITTPLVALSATSLYVVAMEGIQVKGSRVKSSSEKALIVVDSGTVITRLDKALYTEVVAAFKKSALSSYGVKEAPQSAGMGVFDVCFTTPSAANPSLQQLFPAVTFTLLGGSSFTPPTQNMVIPVDSRGTFCLALLPTSGVSILGNYQQQSHLFTFDNARSTLSISSASAC